jgi:cyclohexanone monooxygenase
MLEHARAIGRHHDLYPRALLGTTGTEVAWSGNVPDGRCPPTGAICSTRFVMMGTGPLSRPKLPGIKGIETW